MSAEAAPASWSDLLRQGRALSFVVLCLGIWLNAVDTLVAATIMPSVAREIGGYAYFAWATAGYMLGAMLAASSAGLLAERAGLRTALALSAFVYALGCVVSALAPGISVFLVGRLAQGAGAGLVVGLSYVAVRRSFPEPLWSAVFAALSAVWGVATLLGPLVGGLFAGAHLWRVVFWLFALQAAVFAGAVGRLPISPAADAPAGLPLAQLAALGGAVAMVAAASVAGDAPTACVEVALGVVLIGSTLWLDRRAARKLFPAEVSGGLNPIALGYGAMLCLCAASSVFEVYGAAILQARPGLAPLQAGYAISAESLGWTIASIPVSGAPGQLRGFFIRAGPVCVALGLGALSVTLGRSGVAAVVAAGGVMGCGFGLCWSLIAQRLLGSLATGEEATGAAAIPLTQVLGNATGAAAAGVVANLCGFAHGFTAQTAARSSGALVGAFVPLALLGAAAAWPLGARRRERPLKEG